jgi:adenylate kinase
MNLIILGAPGSGKGTQARMLKDHFNIEIISTGDIIRHKFLSGNLLKDEFAKYVSKGNLLPDDLIVSVIKNSLQEEKYSCGFILDGFPRTLEQAIALDSMNVVIDKVVNIEIEDSVICDRIMSRRICSQCNISYNLNGNRPINEDVCDICGCALTLRDDDCTEEVIKNRLKIYHNQIEALNKYYDDKGILKKIKDQNDIKATFEVILKAVVS